MKKMFIYPLITLTVVAACVMTFLIISTIMAYHPKAQEVLYSKLQPQQCLPQRINITTWNIGYCGLGKKADFFYDGGKMVRSKRKAVEQNQQGIINFLHNTPSDFILLQEVDTDSKRSYHLNELHNITDKLKEHKGIFALNHKTWYTPIPILRPMGQVQAGMATFGCCAPYHAVRYAYPGREAWPEHLFQLKRCFTACRYTDSAFDDGKRRAMELKTLRDFVEKEYEEGNYVIVGGDWNQIPPDFTKKVGTKQYTPHPIAADAMPEGWQWIYDKSNLTMRFTNQPYKEGKTLTSVVDFFLISPNVKALEVKAHNLHFEHSDHNPVTARFELRD